VKFKINANFSLKNKRFYQLSFMLLNKKLFFLSCYGKLSQYLYSVRKIASQTLIKESKICNKDFISNRSNVHYNSIYLPFIQQMGAQYKSKTYFQSTIHLYFIVLRMVS